MPAMYDKFAPFYDLEYGHKEDDLDFYVHLAKEYGSPVLEIGAGTGRISMLLAEEGYKVTGIDNSPLMLQQAAENIKDLPKKKQANIQLVQADMRDFSLETRFPLCVIPFRAFLHNETQEEQLRTLQTINNHLLPGGILAIDTFVPLNEVLSKTAWDEEIEQDELSVPDSGIAISCHVEHNPEKQFLYITNTYKQNGEQDDTCKMLYRYVFRYEMELLLKCSGFELQDVYGNFDMEPYNYYSGTAIYLARKKA